MLKSSSEPPASQVTDGGRRSLFEIHRKPLMAGAARAAKGAARELAVWTRLDSSVQTQQQTQWCWAATSLATRQYYDRSDNMTQCQIVNWVRGVGTACTNPGGINEAFNTATALQTIGNLREDVSRALSYAETKAEIDNGTPIASRITWSGGGAHAMLIEGYRTGTTKMLAIDDPWFGASDVSIGSYTSSYQGTGTWAASRKTQSQRIRILDAKTVSGGTVTAVSRKPHLLDVFMVDTAGRVMSAASDATWDHGRWRGWWHLQGGIAKAGSRVACVARQPDMLDIFVVGQDGGIWTAAWDANQASAKWRGWWRIGNLTVPKGARITAVSRHPDKLDIFVADAAGRVMSAAWQQGDTAWRGWWHIQGGITMPGAQIHCVARSASKLDIFMTGPDRRILTAAWDNAVASGQWRGWWHIQGGLAAPGAPVTAVARKSNQLDVFVVGTNGRVYTAAWNSAVNSGKWQGWWTVGAGAGPAGTTIPCCARSADKLDIAMIGNDGGLWTAAWDQAVSAGAWRGWWRIGRGTAKLGSEMALLRRTSSSLDGFCAGTDGAIYTVAWNSALAGGRWRG